MDVTEKGQKAPVGSPPLSLEGVQLARGKEAAASAPASPQEQSIVPLNREIQESSRIQVSVILPVYNAECWLDECLKSLLEQDFQGSMELSVFNDASTDNSMNIIEKWKVLLEEVGIHVRVGGHCSPRPRGVGFAKNRAVDQSLGAYLCFLDSDDVMMPQRIRLQWEVAIQHPKSIIGCQVRREPADSTERYTRWINSLTKEQLVTQVFTSHGPTVIMPTWFCSREWFCHVGRFDEGGKGTPEDLLYFYEHLRKGGEVFRVNQCLLLYRYHPQATTHSVLEETIWTYRLLFLEERVLSHWTYFTIWNAGKQGKKLFRSLSPTNQKKVIAFCDVDKNKIAKGFYTYEESKENPKPRIPIVYFKDASPPFIICVKLDLTGGQFEENLSQMNLKEGVDYHHFN
ncbi:UDP-GlcNAc:betaGal beta-1,3-N-acetylglucosaminyltransferase-like protein 1 isoform X1 [Eublepharis macularius]|uniref:UDP-GlcNAc:betaGal beta-1,3-N-acetylglucosaminyltransferase-like protein 1 isoform X1 n=1 Tax=Eublepharis macularius TaxID=481883 RepID=A0AA97JBS0_EUBMA|nr:UDP-GlcNAc:betaGal beta-1,3-N-acetylglucosaminyltransferase-like protein 1 isoform X1 [Eublepharis macularius]